MPPTKKYDILEGLPTYGPMYIPVSDNGKEFYSEGFVVRFFKSDGSDWVANFELGLGGISGVYEVPEKQDTFVVLANGTCYFMTPDNAKPIKTINRGVQQILFSGSLQIILICLVDFIIIEHDGQHWYSDRISFDGFKDIKLVDDIISGLSYDPMDGKSEWIEFAFNINTKEISGGSYRQYEFNLVSENVAILNRINAINKPWWKFW